MKRCQNCLLPTTKPGVELNETGVCQGCAHWRQRSQIDYDERWNRLEALANEYRRDDGSYDCLIPVSGGKDSFYQTWTMVEKLDMNPLLVAVNDPFTGTDAGRRNLRTLREAFDCDLITVDLSPTTVRTMVRTAFEELGSPTWPIDRAIYCVPIQMGIKLDIPFIIYGENTSWEYGGVQYDHDDDEPYSAKTQIENDVAKQVDFSLWLENGVDESDLNMMQHPSMSDLNDAGLEPVYLSYFEHWDGYRNYRVAKNHGFRTLHDEWNRAGYIEDYDQIDSYGYLMNVWMKYPKMGYARTTDVVGYRRRSSEFDISINEGVELIREHDHKLDERILDDFLDFTGYTDSQFWEIVESHRNTTLFDTPFHESGTVPRPINDFENISSV